MATTRPKVKANLQVQIQTVEDINYYVVKEPIGGKFVRLREPEYFLLTRLDGRHTPESAADQFIRTYSKKITVVDVEKFISQLDRLGFLEGGSAAKDQTGGSILFIKLKAFDPQRLLDWLYPRTKWLFSPLAVAIQLLLVIVGAAVFFAHLPEFPFSLRELFTAANIVTVVVGLFLLVTFHEFAHALACRHYGGTVREMGFLLLYFQPCFYCNLSDAYLFKRRRERIVVTLAGLFFQMVMWAFFTILWRLTNEGYFLNQLFYLTAAVCFATLLFNLNPAIKLDGYYLLADYLQIPNLRQKAFGYLWERIRLNLFGCKPALMQTPSRREAQIYFWYGLLATLYSILLIGFILYRGAQLLIGAWHGTGFLLFLLVGLAIFHRLIGRFSAALRSVWRERKKVWMTRKRIAFYTLAILIIVALGMILKVDQTTGGPARLIAGESYIVRRVGPALLEAEYFKGGRNEQRNSQLFQLASADPSVTRIILCANVGDLVDTGDTLLLIASTLSAGLLAEAVSELKKSEAERRLLLSNPKFEEIAKKKADVKQAEASYEAARREYNRSKKLHGKNLIPDDELEKKAAEFNIANSAWQSKKSELKLLKSAPKAEEIERIDAEIEKLIARRDYLQSQAEASTIVSPFSGTLVGTSGHNEIFHLARMESVMVEIKLPESDFDILSPTAPIQLRVAAYPSQPFVGEVLKLRLSPQLTAIAAVANPDGILLPEMSGYAKVNCGKISLASLSLRKITRFFRLEVWSWF